MRPERAQVLVLPLSVQGFRARARCWWLSAGVDHSYTTCLWLCRQLAVPLLVLGAGTVLGLLDIVLVGAYAGIVLIALIVAKAHVPVSISVNGTGDGDSDTGCDNITAVYYSPQNSEVR
ncbi:hypothetical protein CPB84DRAFT_1811044 [Gymnopilus junonius]|uniref:Uncharacterized protein n=1 Tax=Gymnopilus junonius TaxID=109634 RepID=A0A9P5N8E7_GYMJU|nr:hypothetical protein CPB84DRAFT_1811044 [Gymnopilus junonius]